MNNLSGLIFQKKSLYVFLILIFLLSCFYILQWRSQRKWQPDGEWILFSCVPDAGGATISRIRPDGTQLQQIISSKQNGKYPIWSPSGEKVVFSKNSKLYLMRPDGSEIEQLSPKPITGYPMAWTSDNQWIIYSNFGAIYRIAPNGENNQLLIEFDILSNPISLSLSPDNQWIFYNNNNGNYVISIDGSTKFTLQESEFNRFNGVPIWSPNEKWILVNNEIDYLSPSYISIFDANNLESLPLTQELGLYQGAASWSPNSEKFVFSANDVSAFWGTLYVMDVNTKSFQQLTSNTCTSYPRWSP